MYLRRAQRLFAAVTGGFLAIPLARCSETEEAKSDFEQTLQLLRARKSELHSKWDYENKHSRLPTISWPEHFPEEEELPSVRRELAKCSAAASAFKTRASRAWLDTCADLQFQLATALVTIQVCSDSAAEGGALMRDLAELEHPDGMVGYALCLLEEKGGIEEDIALCRELLERAVSKFNHSHAAYELGVMYYQGISTNEDEAKAMDLFQLAAESGHCGAMYMLGDCLLEGIGTTTDKAKALEWLLLAGENGHRGARSRLLAVLDDDGQTDHGLYSDSSRQSYRRKSKLERKMTVKRSRDEI